MKSSFQNARPNFFGREALLGFAPFVWTSGSIIFSQGALAVVGLVTARALGPHDKGIATAVLAWAQILGWIGLLGLERSTSITVAADAATRTGKAIGNSLVYTLSAGLALGVVTIAFLPGRMERLGPEAHQVMVWATLNIPLGILGELMMAILLATGRIRRLSASRALSAVMMLVGTLVLWGFGLITVATTVGVSIAGSALTVLVAVAGLPLSQFAVDVKGLIKDLSFGVRLHVASLLDLTNLKVDLLLLSLLAPAADIGRYGLANSFMFPITSLGAAGAMLLMADVARKMEGDVEPRWAPRAVAQISVVKRATIKYGALAAVSAAILALAAPVLVHVLVGPRYERAIPLIWLLAPGFVARACSTVAIAGASGMRRSWVGNASAGAALIVTVIGLALLLSRFGAAGAAITSTLSYATGAAVAWACLARLSSRAGRLNEDEIGTSSASSKFED